MYTDYILAFSTFPALLLFSLLVRYIIACITYKIQKLTNQCRKQTGRRTIQSVQLSAERVPLQPHRQTPIPPPHHHHSEQQSIITEKLLCISITVSIQHLWMIVPCVIGTFLNCYCPHSHQIPDLCTSSLGLKLTYSINLSHCWLSSCSVKCSLITSHTFFSFSLIFRLDALAKALSVIATATWLAGWLAGCHTPVLYQNR